MLSHYAYSSLSQKIFSRNAVKGIAVFAMLLNHISAVFLPQDSLPGMLLIGIGYAAMPVMCFFLSEGVLHTSSLRRYGLRLLVFALLSEIPYLLLFFPAETGTGRAQGLLNAVFTLFFCFCLLCLSLRGGLLSTPRACLLTAVLFLLCDISDWGILAPVMTLLFFHARSNQRKLIGAFAITVLLISLPALLNPLSGKGTLIQMLSTASGPLLAACLCTGYAKQSQRPAASAAGPGKWFFYFFYPLHLLVLFLLSHTISYQPH